MRTPATSIWPGAVQQRASRSMDRAAPRKANAPTSTTAAGQLLQLKYRKLTRRHLDALLDRLFADFTGLHFHIAWAPSAAHGWDARSVPTGCSECCRLAGTSLAAQACCQVCGPRQLVRALGTDGRGLGFNCRLGVRNYWLPIQVRGVTLGIAYLQALNRTRWRKLKPARSVPAAVRVLSQSAFRRAGRLLRLMIQHVQTLDLADLRKAELTNAGHAVLALEKEQTRLHAALQRHLPDVPPIAGRSVPESHPEQVVRELLEHIQQDYASPLTLREYAGKLGMNAAYLSGLFSRAVGRSFKTVLTGVRMQQARELLGDPGKNLFEVAAAVGYTSENCFRIAFKQATGLSPKVWRATMQTNPPSN